MVSIDTLSKYIINKCIDNHTEINNMQLQSLLYIIQAEHLKQTGEKAFAEHIEAWKFGPSVPTAYYRFCYYGSMKIADRFEAPKLTGVNVDIVDQVINKYATIEALSLASTITRPGMAYDRVFRTQKDGRIISPELILECG